MSMELPAPEPPRAGDLLRALRKRAGLSQLDLAQIITARSPRLPGISVMSIGHWERNRRAPGPAQLYEIGEACNATAQELLEIIDALVATNIHYEVLALRWLNEGLDQESCLANWRMVAPLVPTGPARRQW